MQDSKSAILKFYEYIGPDSENENGLLYKCLVCYNKKKKEKTIKASKQALSNSPRQKLKESFLLIHQQLRLHPKNPKIYSIGGL